MKGGCKTVVDILIGMVLGIVLFVGAIFGTVYALLSSYTVGQLQDTTGVSIFDDSGTVDMTDMTLMEFVQELVSAYGDIDGLTINKLIEKYGLKFPKEIAGIDITGIFDVPIKEVPSNLMKIFDKVSLSDVSGSFGVTLPDMDIINDNLSVPVLTALQNIMDEVDGVEKKSLGELDSMFGLGIFDGEDINSTLLALKNIPIGDFSTELDNLYLADIIDIDRDVFVAVGANEIYAKVDRYEAIPEAELEGFSGDRYRLKNTYATATAEQLADTTIAKYVLSSGEYVDYDASNTEHAAEGTLKFVRTSSEYVFSATGTYRFVEYEVATAKTEGVTYYVKTYVNCVTVTASGDPVVYDYTVKADGYVDVSTLFVDTNTAWGAYTVGASLAEQTLDAEGKLAVGKYLVRRDVVTAATESTPAVYSYEELGGYAVTLDVSDATDLQGDVEQTSTDANITFVRTHTGTSDMVIQVIADLQVKNAGDVATVIKSEKLKVLLDIQTEDEYAEATAAQLADGAVKKFVKWGDLYVPYDAADSAHSAATTTKYVLVSEKSSSVLIALAEVNVDGMSDALKTLTLNELMNIQVEDVYRPVTASDADTSLWFVLEGTEYVAYNAANATHAAATTQKYVVMKEKSARVLCSLKDSTLETMSDDLNNLTLEDAIEIDGDEYAAANKTDYLAGKTMYVLSSNGMYVVVTVAGGTFSYETVAGNPSLVKFSGVGNDGVTYTDAACNVRVVNGTSHVVIKQMAKLKINDLGSEMTTVVDNLKLADVMDINECAKVYEGVTAVRDALVASGIATGDISTNVLVLPYEYDDQYVYVKSESGGYYRTTVRYVELTHQQSTDTVYLQGLVTAGATIKAKVVQMVYNSTTTDTPTLKIAYVDFDPSATDLYMESNAVDRAAYDASTLGENLYVYDGTSYTVFDPVALATTATIYGATHTLYLHRNNEEIYYNYFLATSADKSDFDNGGTTVLYYWDEGTTQYVTYSGTASTETKNLYVFAPLLYVEETNADPVFYVEYDETSAAADADAYKESGTIVRYAKKYANDVLYNVNIDLTGGTKMVETASGFEVYDEANAAHAELPLVYLAYENAGAYVVFSGAALSVDTEYFVVMVNDPEEGKMLSYDASDVSEHAGLDTYVTLSGYLTSEADGNDGLTVYLVKGDAGSEKVLVSFKQSGATISTLNTVIGTLTLGQLVLVEPDTILDNEAIQNAKLTSIGTDLKTSFSGATIGEMIKWGGYTSLSPVVSFLVEDIAVSDFFRAITAEISLPNLQSGAGDIMNFVFNMTVLSPYMCYTVQAYDQNPAIDRVVASYKVVSNRRAY